MKNILVVCTLILLVPQIVFSQPAPPPPPDTTVSLDKIVLLLTVTGILYAVNKLIRERKGTIENQ